MGGERAAYDDAYPTCRQTFATLRVYPGAVDPDEVTALLGVEPTRTQRAGEPQYPGTGVATTYAMNGWFLSSGDHVESRDVRRHIDWVLDRVEPVAGALGSLVARGARADLACFWLSASAHGGPILSPGQSRRLAALGLDCWFDVYFEP